MIEAVIFDYGRTIYDPNKGQLFPGTKDVFHKLLERKLKLGLVTIAEGDVEDRQADLVRFGIDHFFGAVQIFGLREQKDFTQVLAKLEAEATKTIIVGDNLRREITLGNRIGAYTVWTRQNLSGPWAPRSEIETPRATIASIQDLITVVDVLNTYQ